MIVRQLFWALLLAVALPASALEAAEFRRMNGVAPPPLALKDMNGKRHSLAAYKGKVVLVNFWATWCPPCREEMPSMQRLKEKMAGRPFTLLGVSSGEQPAELDAFLKLVRVDFTILLDSDNTVARRWKVYGLPTSFLIDKQGKVRYALTGPAEWDEKEALTLIENMLR